MTAWLKRYKLHKYAALMHENGITFSVLAVSTSQELKDELGITKWADRKKLLDAIKGKQEELYTDFMEILEELDLNIPLLDDGSDTDAGAKEGGHDSSDDGNDEDDGGGRDGNAKANGSGGGGSKPCPFETDEDFDAYFQSDVHVVAFKKAFCVGCNDEEFEAWEDDVDSDPCKDAKRAHGRITSKFHPDIVGRRFPACKAKSGAEDLKNWATFSFTNLGSTYNEMRKECRGRSRFGRSSDDL